MTTTPAIVGWPDFFTGTSASSAVLLTHRAEGTAWIAVALIVCMVVSLWTTWVLLAEILR